MRFTGDKVGGTVSSGARRDGAAARSNNGQSATDDDTTRRAAGRKSRALLVYTAFTIVNLIDLLRTLCGAVRRR